MVIDIRITLSNNSTTKILFFGIQLLTTNWARGLGRTVGDFEKAMLAVFKLSCPIRCNRSQEEQLQLQLQTTTGTLLDSVAKDTDLVKYCSRTNLTIVFLKSTVWYKWERYNF